MSASGQASDLSKDHAGLPDLILKQQHPYVMKSPLEDRSSPHRIQLTRVDSIHSHTSSAAEHSSSTPIEHSHNPAPSTSLTMPPYAITLPSSRGIGFALTRLLLQKTTLPIFATARHDPDRTKHDLLHSLPDVDAQRLQVLRVDFEDESTLKAAADFIKMKFPPNEKDTAGDKEGENYARMVFCVPGVLFPEKTPQQVDYNDALTTYKINTLGPLMAMKHLYPLLPRKSASLGAVEHAPKQAVWATMSARVGSVTDNTLGGWYSYRSSKSAVNALVKSFDLYLKNSAGENAISVGLHPGTVKTDLSKGFWTSVKEDKLFAPDQAAEQLFNVVNGLKVEQRGRVWDWEGKEIPP